MKALESLLFEDLRLEKEIILKLDWATIQNLIPLYSSTTLHTLVKWRERNEQ